jgi:hypothetical protein
MSKPPLVWLLGTLVLLGSVPALVRLLDALVPLVVIGAVFVAALRVVWFYTSR